MEKLNQIEDEAVDILLRRYGRQQARSVASCEEFDPEIVSLYIERVLTAAETTRLESHLSGCRPCRQSIVMLTQLAQSETALIAAAASETTAAASGNLPVITQADDSRRNWLAGLKALLLPLTTPRLALAAVAIIALSVSVPFYFSEKAPSPSTATFTGGSEGVAASSPAGNPSPTPNASADTGDTAARVANGEVSNQTIAQRPVANAGSQSATSTTPAETTGKAMTESAPTAISRAAEAPKAASSNTLGPFATSTPTTAERRENEGRAAEKQDAAAKPTTADDQRRSENTVAAAAAPPGAASEKKLEKIDPAAARKLPEADAESVSSTTIKRGVNDTVAANRPEPRAIRPKDNVAQPPAPPADPIKNKSLSGSGRFYPASGENRERAASSRKIRKKTFFLINDVWTDKDFKKDKELPVITLIKDSDVYKEVVAKRPDLLPLFSGFAASEQAIIVYKNTVYKLIPQRNQ